ncbi:IPTL-CTERM sorting domain-containing protein [Ottowia sp.]|uniref:IPTL-CTERM sorting domain-containing protein n=1 Tax=Ottowia sp. TaxID=1898956 RepID=UPI0039E55045
MKTISTLPARAARLFARGLAACAAGLLLASAAQADFVNGNFEDATDFSGWTRDGLTIPSVIPTFPPTTETDLGLTYGVSANDNSAILDAGSATTSTGGGLSWSDRVARVHTEIAGGVGNNNKASSIEQSITITASDVDSDGLVHVRLTAAPVLQDPGHDDDEQPYFFIEITKADGTSLWHTFNFANEDGVPWVTYSDWKYTDWQAFDVSLDATQVGVGDTIKLKVIAAGCGPGGHAGAVYLNNVRTASSVDGASLWVTATGPAVVERYTNADGSTTITYTYTYTNNGTTTVDNVVVNPAMPVDTTGTSTTFVSITDPTTGGTCTGPDVGSTDAATCSIGTLAPGESGTFTMTVLVAAGTTADQVNNGTYPISGTGVPELLGPLVETDLIADLVPDISNLPAGGGTTNVPYPAGASFSCINQGSTTAVGNTLCQVDNLPPGVTVGQCTISPPTPAIDWNAGDPVPPAAVVTCPVTGTPTGPAPGVLQGVTGSDNDGNTSNNTVLQAVVVTPATAVPTLGEWGMMLMAGLLAGLGLGRARRRRG